jgi:hypothetical protein
MPQVANSASVSGPLAGVYVTNRLERQRLLVADEDERVIARDAKEKGPGGSDWLGGPDPPDPEKGLLHDVIDVAQGRKAAPQVAAQSRFARLHLFGKPARLLSDTGRHGERGEQRREARNLVGARPRGGGDARQIQARKVNPPRSKPTCAARRNLDWPGRQPLGRAPRDRPRRLPGLRAGRSSLPVKILPPPMLFQSAPRSRERGDGDVALEGDAAVSRTP